MANKRENTTTEEQQEIRGDTVKKKIEIKKFKSTTRQTGTIDKNKFSIFGEVLEKKKNCGLGGNDDDDPEVDLQQWRKIKLKRTTSIVRQDTIDSEIAEAAARLKSNKDRKDRLKMEAFDEIAEAAARLKSSKEKSSGESLDEVTDPAMRLRSNIDRKGARKVGEMDEIAKAAARLKSNKEKSSDESLDEVADPATKLRCNMDQKDVIKVGALDAIAEPAVKLKASSKDKDNTESLIDPIERWKSNKENSERTLNLERTLTDDKKKKGNQMISDASLNVEEAATIRGNIEKSKYDVPSRIRSNELDTNDGNVDFNKPNQQDSMQNLKRSVDDSESTPSLKRSLDDRKKTGDASADEASTELMSNKEKGDDEIPNSKRSKRTMIRQQKLREEKARNLSTELIRSINHISDDHSGFQGNTLEPKIFHSDDSDETWIKSPPPVLHQSRRVSIDIGGNEFIFLERTESQLQMINDEDIVFEEANLETQIRERYFSTITSDDDEEDDDEIIYMAIGKGTQFIEKHQIKKPLPKTYQSKRTRIGNTDKKKKNIEDEEKEDDEQESGRNRMRQFAYGRDAVDDIDWSIYETSGVDVKELSPLEPDAKSIKLRTFKSQKDTPEEIDWSIYEKAKTELGKTQINDVFQLEEDSESISRNRIILSEYERNDSIDWSRYEKPKAELDGDRKDKHELQSIQNAAYTDRNRMTPLKLERDVGNDIDWSRFKKTKKEFDDEQSSNGSELEQNSGFTGRNRIRLFKSERDVGDDIDWSRFEKTKKELDDEQISAGLELEQYPGSTGRNRLRLLKSERDVGDDIEWSRFEKTKTELDEKQQNENWLNHAKNNITEVSNSTSKRSIDKLKRSLSIDTESTKHRNKPGTIDLQKYSKFGDGNADKKKIDNLHEGKEKTEVKDVGNTLLSHADKSKRFRNRKEMEDDDALDRAIDMSGNEESRSSQPKIEKPPQTKKHRVTSDDESLGSNAKQQSINAREEIQPIIWKSIKLSNDINLTDRKNGEIQEKYQGWHLLASGFHYPYSQVHCNESNDLYHAAELKAQNSYKNEKTDNWILIARGSEDYQPKQNDWVSIAQGSDILESGLESIDKYKRWSMDSNEESMEEIIQQNNFFHCNDRRLWDIKYMPISKRDIFCEY